MTLWIIMTALAATAAYIVVTPFLSRLDQADDAGRIDVYKDQLSEVERERTQGLIDEAEADMARVEIERRILAASKADGASSQGISVVWRQRSVAMTSAVVVLGSVGLYAANGSPDLPGVPFVQPAVATSATQQAAPAQVAANQEAGPHDIAKMIDGLAAKLKEDPNNVEGWRMLGWSYYNTNQFKQAAGAYAKAMELKKDDSQLKSAYGEALVRASDGVVTEEAQKAFSAALKLKADDPRARFFIGLAKQQNGDPKAAITDWVEMLKTAPAGTQWAGDLRQRIMEVAKQTGVNAAPMLAELEQPAAPKKAQAPAGPSSEDVKNAEEMTPKDRMAMIRGMVDGLAEKLKDEPNNPDGWIRLIRSRLVLNEPEKASAALTRAMEVFADKPDTKTRIAEAAKSMGVKPE